MSKQKRKPTPVARESADLRQENIDRLRELFPEAVTEGKIDFAKLRETLGDDVDDRPERYSFTWAGKRDAIRLLQTPSRATLVPCPEESVNFETTNNVFIEGENLEVLKLLYKSYAGRVKMIYIDPPYNTGNDLVYQDDFSDPLNVYLEYTGQVDSEGNRLTSNPETSGRYHSSWLTSLYPRLFVARQLMKDEGVIFVSIDDHEVANLRLLLNQVFGEENFVASIIWQKMDSPSRNDKDRAVTDYHDYILVYARNKQKVGFKQMAKPAILAAYPLTLPDGRLARKRQLRKNGKGARREDRPSMWYPLKAPDGTTVYPVAPEGWEGRWVLSKETWEERTADKLTEWVKRGYGWVPYYIEIAPEQPSVPWATLWTDVDQNRQAKAQFTEIMGPEVAFDNPKPTDIIKRMILMSAAEGDICMDFYAGSGTLAQAVLEINREGQTNRRFLCVQLPEWLKTPANGMGTIADVAKERIRRSLQKLREMERGRLDFDDRETPEDLGFKVFKLAESNYQCWRGAGAKTGEALLAEMEKQVDPLLPGWKPMNVLCEVALKEGYSLTCRVEELKGLTGNTVYRVSDADKAQSFLICLDDQLKAGTVKAMGLKKEDLFICRDVALTDEQAANLALQCNVKTI